MRQGSQKEARRKQAGKGPNAQAGVPRAPTCAGRRVSQRASPRLRSQRSSAPLPCRPLPTLRAEPDRDLDQPTVAALGCSCLARACRGHQRAAPVVVTGARSPLQAQVQQVASATRQVSRRSSCFPSHPRVGRETIAPHLPRAHPTILSRACYALGLPPLLLTTRASVLLLLLLLPCCCCCCCSSSSSSFATALSGHPPVSRSSAYSRAFAAL
jgi:hypothetical protein